MKKLYAQLDFAPNMGIYNDNYYKQFIKNMRLVEQMLKENNI